MPLLRKIILSMQQPYEGYVKAKIRQSVVSPGSIFNAIKLNWVFCQVLHTPSLEPALKPRVQNVLGTIR